MPESAIVRVGIWLVLEELASDPRAPGDQAGFPPGLQARVPRLAAPRRAGQRGRRGDAAQEGG